MTVHEHVPLSSLTTLKVGGPAKYVFECRSVDEIKEAVAFARSHGIPYAPLGQGSNVLASDEGYEGAVLHMQIPGAEVTERGGSVLLRAGAGVAWDLLVTDATEQGLWGLENLSGIPGTVGAAPVQNIGAYGAEVADTLEYVDVIDTVTGEISRIHKDDCAFGYRESRFKQERNLVITHVGFLLRKDGIPKVDYKDLKARSDAGEALTTPLEIAQAVRSVRSYKFPDLTEYGTAGSFFKNPILPASEFERLQKEYPGMPGYRMGESVKVPVAWILDHVLSLRGFSQGPVSLFERHALVLVTTGSARASDVEAVANHVANEIKRVTGIHVEREVRAFP